jgi:hypothetical protein
LVTALPVAVPLFSPALRAWLGGTSGTDVSVSSSSVSGGATTREGLALAAPVSDDISPLENGVRPPNGRPAPESVCTSVAFGEK